MAMVEHFKQGRLRWINLKNPTKEEIKKAVTELGLSPALTADLVAPVRKSIATISDETIKITLDFPVVKKLSVFHAYEVKFLVSKNSLLTVQYDEMQGIDKFKRKFEVAATLNKKKKNMTGVHLFLSLMANLYESVDSKLDYLDSRLLEMETEIFENNEKKMVYEISKASKKLIAFKHTMHSHDKIFRDAQPMFEKLYNSSYKRDIKSIHELYLYLQRRADSMYETLTALRETNAAMLTTKQNEVMKTLTILAFITFPLTLFSSLFGMNTIDTPIVGSGGDFWIILGGMIAAAILFFAYFKGKGWM